MFLSFVAFGAALAACEAKPREAAPQTAIVSIVPEPQSAKFNNQSYEWPRIATVHSTAAGTSPAVAALARYVKPHGILIKPSDANLVAAVVFKDAHDPRLGREGYRLRVARDGIAIAANSGPGFFYGVQTLAQITHGALRSQIGAVRDWPAHSWRGIHLDVSRHFFDTHTVERYIDVAAHYKLNVFHWHLTDDRAWRLQVPSYPRLTLAGSSYSPAQVREVVRYAAARFVTVVPEIDLPGHSSAAIAAYPELGCGRPGILCANHRAAAFVDTVLRFVMQVLPGPYIHTGGDEVPDANVQAYFARHVQVFLKKSGRLPVAWDDLLRTDPPGDTVIMSWHGEAPGLRAARDGHNVVLTPDGPLYFDAYQGDKNQEPPASSHLSSLEQVYAYEPALEGLPVSQRTHILGLQANLWTEHVPTAGHLFYMLLPRELALAEITWTLPEKKNWKSFLRRLPQQLAWLQARAYPFRVPAPLFEVRGARPILFTAIAARVQSVRAYSADPVVLTTLQVAAPNASIRYTTDGTVPGRASAVYRKPLQLHLSRGHDIDIRALAVLPDGKESTISECILEHPADQAFSQLHGARSWESLVSP
ncbi:MAG: hypothetical protein DLM50_08970 [Candidatus Meridianibacter frigidus]|nr:MAG: hypothetical protein DLM50_08970 [Candidatus Eremiobacteraeota bacterium]